MNSPTCITIVLFKIINCIIIVLIKLSNKKWHFWKIILSMIGNWTLGQGPWALSAARPLSGPPSARPRGPRPGPFAKLLNEFVSQRSYFLLASLNYLRHAFSRRSYFLVASLNYLMNLFSWRSCFLFFFEPLQRKPRRENVRPTWDLPL